MIVFQCPKSFRRTRESKFAELNAKLQAQAHVPGPNYIMFNNVYSRDDAPRFRSAAALEDDTFA